MSFCARARVSDSRSYVFATTVTVGTVTDRSVSFTPGTHLRFAVNVLIENADAAAAVFSASFTASATAAICEAMGRQATGEVPMNFV